MVKNKKTIRLFQENNAVNFEQDTKFLFKRVALVPNRFGF